MNVNEEVWGVRSKGEGFGVRGEGCVVMDDEGWWGMMRMIANQVLAEANR